MEVRIHRGSKEIGGNCIALQAQGKYLLLDLGRPLDASGPDDVYLPPVNGLKSGDDQDLLGIIISHPHQDHYGLVGSISARVPLFIGRAAASIIAASTWFMPQGMSLTPTGYLEHQKPFQIGPFRVTPFLNDHSAFDAYSLLVEADGKRLFYTGDIRGSGPKAALFNRLCSNPPTNVDVLLMEGTHVRALPRKDYQEREVLTEKQVEERCVNLIRETDGPVLVAYSGQNFDRVVSLYRAAIRTGREFVVDNYGAVMARATGQPSIPKPGHAGLRVLVPLRDRLRIKEEQEVARLEWLGASRIFADELRAKRKRVVVALRPSLLRDLSAAGLIASDAHAVWSMWHGYWEGDRNRRLRSALEKNQIPITHIHASGHATVAELGRLVGAFGQARVVPIHSEATSRFASIFPRVEQHSDGEQWVV